MSSDGGLRHQRIYAIVRSIAECIVTVVLFIVAEDFFILFGLIRKRGFFCDDESLKYPHYEDTVTKNTLYAIVFSVPLVIVIVGELVLFIKRRKQHVENMDRGFVSLLFRLHHNIVPFYCCFAMHAFFIHSAKIIVSRHRPHFFAVCQPYRITDGSTCNDLKNQAVFIEDYECKAFDDPAQYRRMNIRVHTSFPSAHASYIFYSMVYVIFYLQRFSNELRKCYRIDVGVLLPVLQIACALLAWTISLTRVMDYKHHWSDVVVGILLGSAVAIVVSLYVRQQLNSVNILPQGVKSSNTDPTTPPATPTALTTTSFTTTMPNTISAANDDKKENDNEYGDDYGNVTIGQ